MVLPEAGLPVRFILRPDEASARQYVYRVAGMEVVSDTRFAEMQHLLCRIIDEPEPLPLGRTGPVLADTETEFDFFYRGEGWLDNRYREVQCGRRGDDLLIRVAGLGDLLLNTRSQVLALINPHPFPCEPLLLATTVLGPALILALAQRGIFCLHASAVRTDSGVCAFAGASGQGKSTLAAAKTPRWQRLGDDVLPVTIDGINFCIRPHFPQLKLASARQYGLDRKTQCPLQRIFLLEPHDPDAGCASIVAEQLSPADAALALVHHTIAGRLFPPALLQKHLVFAAQAVATPVFRLGYPKKMSILPDLKTLIINEL